MIKKIPTYIINLPKRKDRRQHVLDQFAGRLEFDTYIVDAIEHNSGSVGLWLTINHIFRNLIDKSNDYFIIVEDDHVFTDFYSQGRLFKNIELAMSLKTEILLGGISWFDNAFVVDDETFWVDHFNATQFVIVFKPFYSKFLNNQIELNYSPDINISKMSRNKLVFHPFISVQKEFGYSDATSHNDIEGYVSGLFDNSQNRMITYRKVSKFYDALL